MDNLRDRRQDERDTASNLHRHGDEIDRRGFL